MSELGLLENHMESRVNEDLNRDGVRLAQSCLDLCRDC